MSMSMSMLLVKTSICYHLFTAIAFLSNTCIFRFSIWL